MDPITTAILAATTAGVVSGVTKLGEQVIVDAYSDLKNLLKKKFGMKSKLVKAVRELESNPKSTARQGVVREEVAAAKADQDQDLLKSAQSLLKLIGSSPDGEHIIQMARGNQNVQISGDGNVVQVNTRKSKP